MERVHVHVRVTWTLFHFNMSRLSLLKWQKVVVHDPSNQATVEITTKKNHMYMKWDRREKSRYSDCDKEKKNSSKYTRHRTEEKKTHIHTRYENRCNIEVEKMRRTRKYDGSMNCSKIEKKKWNKLAYYNWWSSNNNYPTYN